MSYAKFSDLEGEILTHIDTDGCEQIMLTTQSGRKFMIHHQQDCCESVGIESTTGEWVNLIGKVLVSVSEDVEEYGEAYDSGTDTRITFRTDEHTVISRWIGESNGYYSESVDLRELTKQNENRN